MEKGTNTMKRYLLASMAFCIAFTTPSVWASKAWYAEGVIRTDFRDTRISTTGCQGAALDESAGKVFFGTAPDATAAAGIAQYSLLSLTRTEGIVEPDHVAQGVDTYGAMWGRSFGVAKGFVFSCSRNQTEKGKIEVRPYATYSADESTLVSLTGDLDGIADLVLYPVTVNADGTSFYGCDASRLLKFTIGWNKDGSVASLTYAGSCALDRPNAITVAAVGGRELVYAIAENDNKTASDLTILDVTDGAAMSETSTATVSETGDAFGIAVSGIAAGLPHLTVAGNPMMKVLNLTADGTGVDVTTPVATFTTADFFPDAGVGIANRFGLAVTDDETRMFLSVSASQHLMVSAVMPPDWTIYVKATSTKDPVIPTVPYDSEATAAPDLNTAVAYANKLGLRKIRIVGAVNQATQNLDISNVEIFGADRTKDAIAVNTGSTQADYSVLMLKDNVFVHDLKFTKGTSCSYLRSPINLSGANSIVSNCWFTALSAKTGYDVYGHLAGYASAGLITHCLFTNIHTDNSGNDGAHGVGLLGLEGTAQMRNSIFAGNYHGSNMRGPADGVITLKGNAVLENCVIYGNYTKASSSGDSQRQSEYHTHPRNGGGIIVRSGSPTIRNCIIRNNKKPNDYMADPPEGYDMYAATVEKDIYIVDGATPLIENCNLPEGQVPEGAVNCQTENPAFVDAAKNDFSIAEDSPCVDAGAFQKWQVDATDYTGITPRYQGEKVDIGAYEIVKPTPQVAHVEVGGTLEAEKYATATMSAFVTGLKVDSGATFKWYTSDPQEGTPDPIATGNPAEYRFTAGTWTVYLKIENADGAGNDLYGSVADAVVVSRGADFYVSRTGDNGNSGDIDAPFKTVKYAVSQAAPGMRIKIVGTVKEEEASTITLENVEVYGESRTTSVWKGLGTSSRPNIELKANAFLHDVKLDDWRTSGGFTLSDDTACVSNCWANNLRFSTSGSPAASATKGLITHMLYTDCHCNYGPVFSLSGTAKMRNCVITGCRIDNGDANPSQGLVVLSGTTALENNTIYGNWAVARATGEQVCAGVYVAGGTPLVRNNIVRNNKINGTLTTGTECNYYLAAGEPVLKNNNSTEGFGENAQTGDPKFKDPDNATLNKRDFSIAEDSPCVDVGNGKGWRKGATDYAGNPRIQGRRVDIGAYEYNSGVVDWGLQILVR